MTAATVLKWIQMTGRKNGLWGKSPEIAGITGKRDEKRLETYLKVW